MTDQPHRLLIVDDEVDTCANLADIFSESGYHTDIAHNGNAALELVAKNPPYDVVLLDLRMPGMDGLELYHRIKERSAGTEAFIVTAYASSDTAKSALSAGARRVIPKPVNITQLLGLVEEALESPLVLIVDDDKELCDNLWEILHENGFRLHLVHDVDDARRALEVSQFQVIVLDLKLPSGSGSDVLRVISQTNPQARTIIITGHPTELQTRIKSALSEGAASVIFKPFEVPRLLQAISEASGPSGRPAE